MICHVGGHVDLADLTVFALDLKRFAYKEIRLLIIGIIVGINLRSMLERLSFNAESSVLVSASFLNNRISSNFHFGSIPFSWHHFTTSIVMPTSTAASWAFSGGSRPVQNLNASSSFGNL